MKKVLSIVLALVMVCALSVNVFAAETVLYKMEFTAGEDSSGAALADGVKVDVSNGGIFRIASNKNNNGSNANGEDLLAIFQAVQVDGAVVSITYTGSLEDITLEAQSVNATVRIPFAGNLEVVDPDGKRIVEIPGSEFVANAADVLAITNADDFGWWGNFAIRGTSDSVIYDVKVYVRSNDAAPVADETPANEADILVVTPVADPDPAPAPAPADTGIVLAVLPMAVAAAAFVATKRK